MSAVGTFINFYYIFISFSIIIIYIGNLIFKILNVIK